MKILTVSPHPDDVEFGCGALVHKWAKHHMEVDLLVCTGEGDLTMVHSGETIPFSQRKEEQKVAAERMRINRIIWADFAPAGKFDTQPISNLVSVFDKYFRCYNMVLIPMASYMQDHKIVWDAAIAAFRPGKCKGVELYAYEQPMQGHGLQELGPFPQRTYVEVTIDDLAMQLSALRAHHSQIDGRVDTVAGTSGVLTLAEFRGLEIGYPYATMLYPIRTFL